MSRYDYIVARELIEDTNVSFNTLVMALLVRVEGAGYHMIRSAFPDITQEYWDRYYGVNGYVRGESSQADKVYQDRDTDELAIAQHNAKHRRKRN